MGVENRYTPDRTHPRRGEGQRFTRLQTGEERGEQSREGRERDQCLLFADRNDGLSPNRKSEGESLETRRGTCCDHLDHPLPRPPPQFRVDGFELEAVRTMRRDDGAR